MENPQPAPEFTPSDKEVPSRINPFYREQKAEEQKEGTENEKLEKELAGLEQEAKEKKGSDAELIQIEIEKIKKEIEEKKESSKEQGEKGTERVEKSGGEPEDIEDAKKAGEVLNAKTEEVAGEAEMSATDLFEQAQAMEAGQEAKPAEAVEKKNEVEQVAEVATPKGQEKTQSRWEKTKGILADEQIRNQIAKTTAGTVASIAGVKSLYDVPAYLYQRFKVSGIFGHGKGLTGSVEELVTKSEENTGFGERYSLWGEVNKLENDKTLPADKKEEKLAELKRKLTETEPTKVRDAIENVNARLALTKEGEQKHSDQRKLIAKVLWERRTKEKMSMDDVRGKMDSILDDYTTTKVSGMQAVRESLNTALVASGALSLRGVSYAALDAVERKQRLDKEAKNQDLSLEERYQRLGDKNAKSVGKEATWWKDVFVGSIKETCQEAFAQGPEDRTTKQKILDSVKAWGKIAKYAGMGATVSFRPEAFVGDMDKVLDTLSGKASFGDVAENFQGNIERTIDVYKNIANKINPFSSEGSSVEDKSTGGKSGEVEYQEGKRFPMGERPEEILAPAPVSGKLGELQVSLIVQKGEGVSHALLRQLSDDPEKFGFTGDSKDDGAVMEWARSEVKGIVTGGGYWDQSTDDGVGVSGEGGDAAYEMEKGSDGILKINTYLKNDAGNFVKTETREVLKDLEKAQLKTNMGPREYMRYGKPEEPSTAPVIEAPVPVKESLIVPESPDEAMAKYQPPIYDTPRSALGSDTLGRGEVYAVGVEEPTQKYTYNMPDKIGTEQPVSVPDTEYQTMEERAEATGGSDISEEPETPEDRIEPKVEHAVNIPSVDHEQLLAIKTQQINNDLNKMFGTRGIFGIGKTSGIDSPDWKDPQAGFANKTVEEVVGTTSGKPRLLRYGRGVERNFGIKSSEATRDMKEYLTETFNKTRIPPKTGEKTGEYITRALTEKANSGGAQLTETPVEMKPENLGIQQELPKIGLDTETKIPTVEHSPEVKVEDIVTKTEVEEGSIIEKTGVSAEIKGSTGQEFLSKDYMLKLKPSAAGAQFARTEAMMTSRSITARMGAYHELLKAGKTEEAAKHLEALRKSIDMADKSLGEGVIDRSKIPELKK